MNGSAEPHFFCPVTDLDDCYSNHTKMKDGVTVLRVLWFGSLEQADIHPYGKHGARGVGQELITHVVLTADLER